MQIRKVSMFPLVKMYDLRQLFLGVSYANQLSLLSQLTASRYDPGSSTINTYFSQMSNICDPLEIVGMSVVNNLYAGILTLGVPNNFPDVAHTFKAMLLAQPKTRISPSHVIRAIGEGYVYYKRNHPTLTDAMKTKVHEEKKDTTGQTCHYCQKAGNYARDFQKKAKEEKNKKVETEVAESKEPEIEDIAIGYPVCVL